MTDAQSEASSARASTAEADIDAQLRRRNTSKSAGDRAAPAFSPLRRRSSLISFTSIEDARTSFHEDIIQPASARRKAKEEHEITHWSSTPLAFAILPAVAGVLFTNGSAFVTDVLLLAFAAIFLNWSIRVPREWYYSAQAVRKVVDEDDIEDESAIEEDGSPAATQDAEQEQADTDNSEREAARAQLRRQESLALLATFIFPALAAYLLHVIRSQLSLPSTSLVSDYNISVFLLAAEFWPARQVIRLIAARTLHLQRVASGLDDPFTDPLAKSTAGNAALLARLEALEHKIADSAVLSSATQPLQPSDLSSLDARIHKRLEPRLDSLDRAVRRYEKRYTTLAMVSDQRFQSLETRLQDALALAAVAAQHSQRQSTIVRTIFSTATEIVTLPVKLTWELITWPYKISEEVYVRTKILLLGPQSHPDYLGKKRVVRHTNDLKIKDDKMAREKPLRKLVR
ncbi:hypothetical protein AMS68_004989 [Peltaster fructicola]|uniref:Uncharacterized protein n=1 Tax=Peltaster fructicola TaxID=286661 RepID=A0A6H0XXH2_9PEZI|nr:hypothetical protein AMS68_004989 [Peltaster fructicola]